MKPGKASTRSTERAGTKIFAKIGSREVPRVATRPLVFMILLVRDMKFCESGHHTSLHVRDTILVMKAIIVRTSILNFMFISKRFGHHRPFSILKI